jgi:hypothetical protein
MSVIKVANLLEINESDAIAVLTKKRMITGK